MFPSARVSCLLRSDAIFECEWRALVGGETGINQQALSWSSSSFQALGGSCLRAKRGKWTQRSALGTAEVRRHGETATAISREELGSQDLQGL